VTSAPSLGAPTIHHFFKARLPVNLFDAHRPASVSSTPPTIRSFFYPLLRVSPIQTPRPTARSSRLETRPPSIEARYNGREVEEYLSADLDDKDAGDFGVASDADVNINDINDINDIDDINDTPIV